MKDLTNIMEKIDVFATSVMDIKGKILLKQIL